ncbi:hypothetical protein BDB01DRAFT_899155 [Pilobolus umbonatus]|nr:hypothetical protein BDB01DRAFT_899155 [Pilobolus umbonatus]
MAFVAFMERKNKNLREPSQKPNFQLCFTVEPLCFLLGRQYHALGFIILVTSDSSNTMLMSIKLTGMKSSSKNHVNQKKVAGNTGQIDSTGHRNSKFQKDKVTMFLNEAYKTADPQNEAVYCLQEVGHKEVYESGILKTECTWYFKEKLALYVYHLLGKGIEDRISAIGNFM